MSGTRMPPIIGASVFSTRGSAGASVMKELLRLLKGYTQECIVSTRFRPFIAAQIAFALHLGTSADLHLMAMKVAIAFKARTIVREAIETGFAGPAFDVLDSSDKERIRHLFLRLLLYLGLAIFSSGLFCVLIDLISLAEIADHVALTNGHAASDGLIIRARNAPAASTFV